MKENEQDRISGYLSIGNQNMLFGELSDDFLMAMGAREILHGIPVPIGQGENGQIAVRSIFIDMAKVIGGDASFVYADKYLTYIKAAGGDNAEPMLVSEGAKAADEGRYEDACKLLRAALMVDPKSQAAQYLYGRACKACYEIAGDDEAFADDYESIGKIEADDGSEFPQNAKRVGMEGLQSLAGDRQAVGNYIGNFKAESMDTFEVLTMMHPDFAMGYYFLGYAYLNMGLYLKAKLTWDEFIKLSSAADINEAGLDYDQLEDLRNEVTRMLLDLDDPVKIEKGCNQIMSGDFVGGRNTLIDFTTGRYENWWPLWYYLGVAESALGNINEAISDLKKVLTLSPSNTDVMDELAQLYEAIGDVANAAKYRNKINTVNANRELERQENMEG